ncbi:MAG: Bro-N domain-containing protein [Nevskia sp.]|nr:Bro-N domain-containing protein [Nevskia sp.]
MRGKPWLSARDVALALGYSQANAIHRLYTQHAAEFTGDMARVIESMTPAEHGGAMKQSVRIFSPRGCHLPAMFARTANAAAFRRWVLDVLEGYAPAPVAPADRVLTEPAYRLEAQQFAQNTMAQYRALLPAGTSVPAWDAAAEQRLADGLIAAVLGANRWLVSFDHTQRLQATPVPRHAAIIDPKNAENMVPIMNEYVPVALLPQLVQIGVERLARLARQAGM